MEQLIEYFKDKHIASSLDVGCGTGNFIEVLKKAFPKAEITGIDPDKDSLSEASKRFPEVAFQSMKGEEIQFGDDSFDAASISMVLHHLSSVRQTLLEMKRVVKPGGWLVINELFSDGQNPAQEVHKRMHHFRSKIDRMNGITHNPAFTRKQIIEMIESAGLQLEFKFEFKNPAKIPSKDEIEERKSKLRAAVETIKGKEQYQTLLAEIPEIEAALDKHGFEMSTRLVCVAMVVK